MINALLLAAIMLMPQPKAKALKYSATTIYLLDNEFDRQGSGTAWAYSKEFLITADHVCAGIDEGLTLALLNRPYRAFYLTPIYRDPIGDVCVLDGNPGLVPLKLRRRPMDEGEHIYVYGSPMGIAGSLTDGYAGPLVRMGDGLWRQMSAPATGGNSGGPVLDNKGRVVGMLVAGYARYSHVTYSSPWKAIKKGVDHVSP